MAEHRLFKVCCILWSLVFGLRGRDVGNDTPGYADFIEDIYGFYGSVSVPNEGLEEGFVYIIRFLTFFTSSYTLIFSLFAALLFIAINKIYIKNGTSPLWGMLILMLIGTNWNIMMVAFRQSIAMIFMLFALLLMDKLYGIEINSLIRLKRFWIAMLLVIISMTIHRTMIIIYPILAILFFFRIGKRLAYLMIIGSFILSFMLSDLIAVGIDFFLVNLEGASESEGMEALAERYQNDYGANRMSLVGQLIWAVPGLLAVYYYDYNNNDAENTVDEYNRDDNLPEDTPVVIDVESRETLNKQTNYFYLNCLIVSVCIYLIFQQSSMVTRINLIFIILGFSSIIPEKARYSLPLFYFYILYTLMLFIRAYIGATIWFENDTSIPYKFFWE